VAAFPTVRYKFDDMGEQRGSALSRVEMEAGPPKQALKQSRVMLQIPLTLVFLSKAEFDAFETFFVTTVRQGADWFDWTHPRTGTVHQARFVAGQEWRALRYQRATLDLIELSILLEYWSA
jgi:hypothetical protein